MRFIFCPIGKGYPRKILGNPAKSSNSIYVTRKLKVDMSYFLIPDFIYKHLFNIAYYLFIKISFVVETRNW